MRNTYQLYFKNYFNIKGRVKRSSFWFALSFNFIITVVLLILLFLSTNIPMTATLVLIATMFVAINIIPTITAMIRRIHDTGRHSYAFIIYIIYSLFVIIWHGKLIDNVGVLLIGLFIIFTLYFLIIFLSPTRYELIDKRKFI